MARPMVFLWGRGTSRVGTILSPRGLCRGVRLSCLSCTGICAVTAGAAAARAAAADQSRRRGRHRLFGHDHRNAARRAPAQIHTGRLYLHQPGWSVGPHRRPRQSRLRLGRPRCSPRRSRSTCSRARCRPGVRHRARRCQPAEHLSRQHLDVRAPYRRPRARRAGRAAQEAAGRAPDGCGASSASTCRAGRAASTRWTVAPARSRCSPTSCSTACRIRVRRSASLALRSGARQLFVSDLYTGMIHRIDLDGRDLGAPYDHGVTGLGATKQLTQPFNPRNRPNIASDRFDAENPTTWGYAPPPRRVWGLAVHQGRLYYAVAAGPQIWSVGIGRDGRIRQRSAAGSSTCRRRRAACRSPTSHFQTAAR